MALAEAVIECLRNLGYLYTADPAQQDFRFECVSPSGLAWRSQLLLSPEVPLVQLILYLSDKGYP